MYTNGFSNGREGHGYLNENYQGHTSQSQNIYQNTNRQDQAFTQKSNLSSRVEQLENFLSSIEENFGKETKQHLLNQKIGDQTLYSLAYNMDKNDFALTPRLKADLYVKAQKHGSSNHFRAYDAMFQDEQVKKEVLNKPIVWITGQEAQPLLTLAQKAIQEPNTAPGFTKNIFEMAVRVTNAYTQAKEDNEEDLVEYGFKTFKIDPDTNVETEFEEHLESIIARSDEDHDFVVENFINEYSVRQKEYVFYTETKWPGYEEPFKLFDKINDYDFKLTDEIWEQMVDMADDVEWIDDCNKEDISEIQDRIGASDRSMLVASLNSIGKLHQPGYELTADDLSTIEGKMTQTHLQERLDHIRYS